MYSQINQILSFEMIPIVLKVSYVGEVIGLHLKIRTAFFQEYLYTLTLKSAMSKFSRRQIDVIYLIFT